MDEAKFDFWLAGAVCGYAFCLAVTELLQGNNLYALVAFTISLTAKYTYSKAWKDFMVYIDKLSTDNEKSKQR